MKEEQKYNGSKTRNYFTAYLLASIRGKRLRYGPIITFYKE